MRDGTENETMAEKTTRELGQAAGRRLTIRQAKEYIHDELNMTALERYELALALLDTLNYEATAAWTPEPSRDVGGDDD